MQWGVHGMNYELLIIAGGLVAAAAIAAKIWEWHRREKVRAEVEAFWNRILEDTRRRAEYCIEHKLAKDKRTCFWLAVVAPEVIEEHYLYNYVYKRGEENG